MNAVQGRADIPIEVIERGLKDQDCDVRAAAKNAVHGRADIPIEVIERGLKDQDCDVRAAAMKWYESNGINPPIVRTIEPPKLVYKKCAAGVIVIAEIPIDAQVRGSVGNKCRASKATIVDIIGDFAGEKVGISKYDNQTMYFIGDEIEISGFDYSDEECSTGFHFFCTLKEAKNY